MDTLPAVAQGLAGTAASLPSLPPGMPLDELAGRLLAPGQPGSSCVDAREAW